ncbi:LPS-assembly protein [Breoghania corrubedonensis]|uniref:LPS-assembly protein LptD n=1 Tax=Breoghania corrubedonensis TaxID=665038 RepID=A0A2T5V9J4_9HYPH|nr:LPS-assembly protein LptD [Breoghania corrubedonensis]PTW60436.1 LPS-assembly protein [Breoghania corrubedonensis]
MSGSSVLPPNRVGVRHPGRAFGCGLKGALRGSISLVAVLAVLASAPGAVLAQAQDDSTIEKMLTRNADPKSQMLLEATELEYNFDKDIVSAIGDVQIYYEGNTLEADRVTLDRKKARLYATGNVRLTEPEGNVIESDSLELSDDFRNGFVRQLRVETIQRTRFTAESAERKNGETTTFKNGIYTVYTKPTNPPDKPPLWRIKATKIVHKEKERTVYYEGARLEFWGVPIAYLPFMSHPDPTLKRKSGFLTPTTVYDEKVGVGVSVPYYWVLGPDKDLTFTATPLSKQGPLLEAMWRQRLENGKYSISLAGIHQAKPENFSGSSGDREWRGYANTKGEFTINERWKWGWDLSRMSDRAFVKDYEIDSNSDALTSSVYLTGLSERNYFDVHAYAFQITQEDDPDSGDANAGAPFSDVGANLQDKQPIVHPVIDYSYIWDNPVVGGELSFAGNLTSLTRNETDAFAYNGIRRFRGVEGTFTRTSVKAQWRRTLIDPIGQMFTPFAYVKADLYFLQSADKNVSTLTDEAFVARAMPAVGLEYRYPFLITTGGSSHVIEPIAQIIVRPSEQRIGELPNDDAQSLVFDDTNLFQWDKFSGNDRSEGGTRANVGFQYKGQFHGLGSVNALFGRSFHIAGTNSYATDDVLATGTNSGLESDDSDYVSRVYFDTNLGLRFGARARFDNDNFAVRRAEVQASGTRGPFSASLGYAFLGAKPAQGIDDDREEILGAGSLRLLTNWRVFGSVRYDLRNSTTVRDAVGLGYDDEGFSASLAYAEDRSRNDGDPVDKTIYLRIGLRTLGDTQLSTNADR